MHDAELKKFIRDSAQYIKDRRRQKMLFERASEDYEIIKDKLDRAERHLNAALKELGDLRAGMRYGSRWWAFREARPYVKEARDLVGKALAPLSDATVVVRRDKVTRALEDQRIAVRLAYAHDRDPRQVRSVARRIMIEAGIKAPKSESTITNWINKERASDTARLAAATNGKKRPLKK